MPHGKPTITADVYWRSDPDKNEIALEIEGGTYTNGRHVRGSGYRHDCEKYNLAASLGWRVFRATSDMLRDDLPALVAMIAGALAS